MTRRIDRQDGLPVTGPLPAHYLRYEHRVMRDRGPWMLTRWLAGAGSLITALSACSLPPPPDVEPDAGPPDAAPPGMAALAITPDSHAFGDVTVGSQSGVQPVRVRNIGDAATGALTLSLAGDHGADFAADVDACFGAALGPSEECTVEVRFAPTAPGERTAYLEVSGDPGGTVTTSLRGDGLTPGDLVITEGEDVAFGAVPLGTASPSLGTVTVQNGGGATTASLTVVLGDEVNYDVVDDECSGVALAAGASCTVELRFQPTAVGATPATLAIRESPSVGITAALTGTGTARVQMTAPTGGTVASAPAGLACGPTCGPVTFEQSPITLTATVTPGYAFDAWTGGCAGTLGAVCTLALDAELVTVGATFTQLDCIPDASYCDDATGRFLDCGPTGEIEQATVCPLGCSTTSEVCLDVDPSNGLAAYLDMATGPSVSFAGSSTMNTQTGAVTNNGTTITVPSFTVDTPSFMRVFIFSDLSIAGTLDVGGNRAPVLVVAGDVSITGTLSVASFQSGGGPGSRNCSESAASYMGAGPSPGAGGGGHAFAGAPGGAAGNGTAGRVGVSPTGEPTLEPLRGGCHGGYVWDTGAPNLAAWGGGGGAVQIVSRTRIQLTGWGAIDASGGGGVGETSSGGPGGGAGGGVLLEAPQIVIDGPYTVVSTKGGGGAAAGSVNGDGDDGGTGSGVAEGGRNGTLAAGGNGGNRLTQPTAGGAGTTSTADGAGGGGSIGYARFNNRTGTFTTLNGGRVEASSSAGVIRSRPMATP